MRVLCDTNIFIHAFNGNGDTISVLTDKIGIDNVVLPAITVMELYQGMLNKVELNQMKKKIQFYDVLDIDKETSYLAIQLIERYRLSHNLQIADGLIAAAAVVHNIPLFTYNLKDFKFIPDITLYQ